MEAIRYVTTAYNHKVRGLLFFTELTKKSKGSFHSPISTRSKGKIIRRGGTPPPFKIDKKRPIRIGITKGNRLS